MKVSCIQHGDWGPYCGPDCREMTDQWNANSSPWKQAEEVDDTLRLILMDDPEVGKVAAYHKVRDAVPFAVHLGDFFRSWDKYRGNSSHRPSHSIETGNLLTGPGGGR